MEPMNIIVLSMRYFYRRIIKIIYFYSYLQNLLRPTNTANPPAINIMNT